MSNLRSARLVGIGAIAGIALSLGLSALAERGNTGRNVLPLDELRQFSEVFGTIKAYYVEPVKDNKLITDAISGMLTGLDPHSAYLDENAFKELQVNTQGEFGGLGIEIGTEDGFIKVVSPIEGTPASKAGVKAGDLIIKIGDTPTKDMRLEEAVKMMRGKPKSPITLTLQRKGVPEPIVLTIVRDIIQVQSVRSKLLEPGVGYIRISQFQEHTVNNLVNHLEQLAKQNNGPLKSVVLDLRNDPGGLLHGAIDRIKHVHFKDVRPEKMAESKEARRSFLDSFLAGMFTVPGDGTIDFTEPYNFLVEHGYKGWILVEAEQDPKIAPPLEYAHIARDYVLGTLLGQ